MTATPFTLPPETRARQQTASDPAGSAWVSANAGSGKTHVLTQRVLRLLLAGTPPGRILCLTFTKAAAANMAIRVFDTLATWTRLDDAPLARAIADTGAPAPDAPGLAEARKLFARTVETPGGLKIQTIHAFCERLLHLFPFEANVPARFEVLDDARGADLLLRAREEALAAAMADESGDLGAAVRALAGDLAEQTFDKLIGEALGHRAVLRAAVARGRGLRDLARGLGEAFGLADGEDVVAVEREIVEGGIASAEWAGIARQVGADGGDADTLGNRLAAVAVVAASGKVACEAYLDVFLTQKHEPRKRLVPAAVRKAHPSLADDLDREQERVFALLDRRKAALTVARSAALLTIAAAILGRYDTAKRRRGLLDFDDLVERTGALLERSDAAWVLFKLDRGIDHILIDEAQDTSPAQWDILRAISAEFFAGAGARPATRTFFAVGDEKQSIYSFQGARPDRFAIMREHFRRQAENADHGFSAVPLLLSFRSAKAILAAVDKVFAHAGNARGLVGGGGAPPPHEAHRQTPGLVEIWPLVTPAPSVEPADWRLPVDVADIDDPAVVLARRVASVISGLAAPGSVETVEDRSTRARRPIRPGDVLILVRSRGAFFEAMIRALKDRGVPVAGADRLALTEHIAVMDLIAAGRAALAPGDDFTLACVLKSPLVGLDDDDLIVLAPERKGSLFDALQASTTPAHGDAWAKIDRWRKRAAWLTPFAFYTRLLGADRGRRDLLARLGSEAADAIDEFVALTVAHERDGAPSLLAFLARLDGADLTAKRDPEAAGDAVRVMTVHAAKGLEAKVVFLPDTCSVPDGRHDPKLFPLGGDAGDEGRLIAWSPKADADPAPVAAARADVRAGAIEEHNRLLYVAMTRAEERLYVAGHAGEKGAPDLSWYAMVAAAGLDTAPHPAPWDASESVSRFADPAPPPAGAAPPSAATHEPLVLPQWIARPPARPEEEDAPPVRPSNPLGAADQFAPVEWSFADRHRTRGRRDAATLGRLMHKLLQHLPQVEPANRPAAAARFLAAQGGTLDPERRETLAHQALDVIADSALAPLFAPGSRAEVVVAASVSLPSGRRVEVTGQIDRIGITPDTVFIADYKTGTPARDLTSRHVLQLALYRAAVAPLYADRRVRAFLVWTGTPEAVEIEPDRLDAALRDMD